MGPTARWRSGHRATLNSVRRKPTRQITIKCTGVAGRAFSEFEVAGRNPVIWVVMRKG